MAKSQEDFLRELLADFKIEAAEHRQAILEGMLLLEKMPPPEEYKKIIETTFREFHSLKGAARAVNQLEIEKLCQALEGVFHKLKDGNAILTKPLLDLLFKGADALTKLLSDTHQGHGNTQGHNLVQLLKAIDNQLKTNETHQKTSSGDASFAGRKAESEVSNDNIPEISEIAQADTSTNEHQSPKETVRISTTKLNNLLRQSEEFISARVTLAYFLDELNRLNHNEFQVLQRDLTNFNVSFSHMVDELIHDVKSTLLLPFSSLTDIVPMIVHDLSREFGKEIELTITGAEAEIDRRILEEMKDPLIHLIRNSIDHGIEKPDLRVLNGKSPRGSIKINIYQESGRKLELVLSDDGKGIDREKLKVAALKNSVATKQNLDQMSDQEILSLVFSSGVSTSSIITDLSGRGLGMAIVAAKVESLGGFITIQSEAGQGTSFVISLPLTLSTFRGVIVRVFNQYFVVPTSSVEQVMRIKPGDIQYAESKPFISRNRENIALVKLSDTLGVEERQHNSAKELAPPVLIITNAHHKIAFIVDEVLGEQEGIVKDLGPQLLHIHNLSGATVLGNGQVISILHIPELMESALKAKSARSPFEHTDELNDSAKQQLKILVAEDSITSRMLLRNILETAGYLVKIAVDGLEAFQYLQNEHFDLVVSDVEMPGMNGFELTSKIRSDPRLTAIPVVLVTALSSDWDRQRGLEAGANAYIVKSNFEQSNLLEVVERLIGNE